VNGNNNKVIILLYYFKLINFIRTVTSYRKSLPLHIASRLNSIEIVKYLLGIVNLIYD
jgi:hypothetical protein